jgi:hypothetical protein
MPFEFEYVLRKLKSDCEEPNNHLKAVKEKVEEWLVDCYGKKNPMHL